MSNVTKEGKEVTYPKGCWIKLRKIRPGSTKIVQRCIGVFLHIIAHVKVAAKFMLANEKIFG